MTPDHERAPHYRRARAAALFWEQGRLLGGNYWKGSAIELSPRDVCILHALEIDHTPAQAARLELPLPGGPASQADLERLHEAGLLVRDDDPDDHGDRFADTWRHWGIATQIFHSAARHIRFADDQTSAMRAVIEQGPPPPPVKRYTDLPRIPLPRDLPPLDVPLEAVLASRRTWRLFTGAAIPLPAASKLLLAAFGATLVADVPGAGRVLLKTSPSGGARHPTEAYVAVQAVGGIPRGLYHYDPVAHALGRLADRDPRDDVPRWLGGQTWCQHAALTVFLTAVPARVWYKYKHGRAYRVMLLDQGHLGQTFALTATALDLGSFVTHALDETAIGRTLGLDGIDEFPSYALGAGVTPVPVLDRTRRLEPFGDRPPRRLAIAFEE